MYTRYLKFNDHSFENHSTGFTACITDVAPSGDLNKEGELRGGGFFQAPPLSFFNISIAKPVE